jgi:Xaa-Pro aminopeptidase
MFGSIRLTCQDAAVRIDTLEEMVMDGLRKAPIANVARLHAFMDRAGVDVVVARAGHNFAYLSGVVYPGTLARHMDLADSPRAVMVIWPRQGRPRIVTNSIAAGLARRDSWIEDVVLYDGYLESPYARLAETLREMGLASGRVAMERDYVSARDWALVAAALPGATLVDSSALMDGVRVVKTAEEVELIKRGADLLDDVFLEVFQTIKPGVTERTLHARMIGGCLTRGFEWAHGILNSDKNTVPYAGESDWVLNSGDVIRTDYVAYLRNYPGHQSRNAILGKPSPQQVSDYARNLDIYRGAIDRCRAGARVGDIYDFVMAEFARAGWDYKTLLIGHSVGTWWHQQEPILIRGSDVLLEVGMVLALEPHKAHWHVQDMVLVGDGPPRLLSDRFPTDHPFIAEG